MIISKALDKYARDQEKNYTQDRTQTVGASEIGLCARKIAWIKQGGVEKDPDYQNSWGAHFRGTTMEKSFWAPAMEAAYGTNLLYSGHGQKTFASGHLSATPDGLLTGLPRNALEELGVPDIEADCLLVECKTIDPRVNLTRERESNHFQVQVQIGLIRKETPFKPVYAVISYIDASFWNEVDEFPVKFDEGLFENAEIRATQIMTLDPKELKPEGWIAGGSECEYCPFTRACGVVRRSVPEREVAADPQFVAEVTDICLEIQAHETSKKDAERQMNELKDELKNRLRAKKVRRIPGVVSWSAVKGRDNWDMKGLREAAKAAGVPVEDFSTAGEPTDRLQILV